MPEFVGSEPAVGGITVWKPRLSRIDAEDHSSIHPQTCFRTKYQEWGELKSDFQEGAGDHICKPYRRPDRQPRLQSCRRRPLNRRYGNG